MADPLTSDDIQTLFGRDLTAAEVAAVNLYIVFAEGEIEAYLGRPIHITEFEENCFANAAGTIYLKNTPVVTIEELTVNGQSKEVDALTVTSYGLENAFELTWDWLAFDDDRVDTDALYNGAWVITYTAGLDYPQAIKSLVAAAVMRRLSADVGRISRESNDAVGVKSIKIEDYQITYENSSSFASGSSSLSMFTSEADFNSIKRYKRIGVT